MTAVSPLHKSKHYPLALRVVIGVLLGIALGEIFGKRHWWHGGLSNTDLGDLGKLVITMLTMLATPLVFFAVLDAFLQTRISARSGLKLVCICLLNVAIAMTITLVIVNTLKPGMQWFGHTDQLLGLVKPDLNNPALNPKEKVLLDPLSVLKRNIPGDLATPFQTNNVIAVALLSVLVGAALRRIKDTDREENRASILTVERLVSMGYQVMVQLLEWLVQTVPFAVMAAVAKAVGDNGLIIFQYLWVFLVVVLLGLALHSLLYYPFMAWVMGRKSPRVYLGVGWEAILTGLSTNSSLATVPKTLACLQKMGVSKSSARLAACVGTNLNNDGITLYEAMAALFMAQALGVHLTLGKQFVVVFSSILAGAGVAGIPEAGLVILPLVLTAAGLPPVSVLAIVPIIVPVDWIIARCRSGVNVMSDMLVAIQLDGRHPRPDGPNGDEPDEPDEFSAAFAEIEAIAERESVA